MIDSTSQALHVILYEGEGSKPITGARRYDICAGLLEHGYAVTSVRADQGVMAPAGHDFSGQMLVIGDFGGQAPDLEDLAGSVALSVHDIGSMECEAVVTLADDFRDGRPMNQPPGAGGKSWKPWFPVIDFDRCTNCMQCLSFCLFDVYGLDENQQIQVRNQDNCKTNCPACSRVCPEVAIMFPKHAGGPINGAPVSEEDLRREKMKVDISSLLGGDIYSSLRERSAAAKSRFSKERSPSKALAERKKCLDKLQREGLVPAEVLASIDLASLPSPEEIQRRVAEIKEGQEDS